MSEGIERSKWKENGHILLIYFSNVPGRIWWYSMTHCSWHISAYSTHSMDMLCASKLLGHLINPLHLHTRMRLFMD